MESAGLEPSSLTDFYISLKYVTHSQVKLKDAFPRFLFWLTLDSEAGFIDQQNFTQRNDLMDRVLVRCGKPIWNRFGLILIHII